MAKKYECEACQEEFIGDRQSELVDQVKTHAKEEHNMEMEESEIRNDITDT